MIPYLARLLTITLNNGTLLGKWKKATVFPIYKGVIVCHLRFIDQLA